MTPQDAIAELLARVGASHGVTIFIDAQELRDWPIAAVAAMKAEKLLVKARPAQSVVSPGCERECVMPVHAEPSGPSDRAAFVVCDKRSDINRVNVPLARLERWQASGESIANLTARLLALRRPSGRAADAGRWEVGMFKGTRHASHLVLLGDGELRLSLAGHSIALARWPARATQNPQINGERGSARACVTRRRRAPDRSSRRLPGGRDFGVALETARPQPAAERHYLEGGESEALTPVLRELIETACRTGPCPVRNGAMFNNTQRGANVTHTILRLPVVKTRTGLSRSTIYLRIAQGTFPRPVALGGRAVGWLEAEIQNWVQQCIEAARLSRSSKARSR
jgi:predicted DNA-binding transcriptional regulator AlpA